jgi:potassium/hydrogen antiporter
MNLTADNILLIGSILLFISLLASKTTKYGIPILILFLFVGMLAGSDGIGGIYFYDPEIAKFIGAIALSFILFSGGLETKVSDIRPIMREGILLSTLGVILTCFAIGWIVTLLTDFSLFEGLLLGAIVSSTDAAAVFSILRSNHIGLKGNLRPLLEFESGSNDPMAYFLTIVFIYLVSAKDASYGHLAVMFVKQMVFGGLVGYFSGILMWKTLNWIRLEYDGLYSVFLITWVLFVFSFTYYIGGNPFLAVYISACVLGNRDFIHKKSLTKHFDGQAWIMQIIMFITLGLLVFPKQIIPHMGTGLVIAVLLIFVARPLSVFISLSFFRMGIRKKLFLSWVGLRGAVPIILATYPLTAGIEKAGMIFNLVFFISVVSVMVQGTTIPLVAKWLKLSVPLKVKKKTAIDLELSGNSKSLFSILTIGPESPFAKKSIVELGLPASVTIVFIERKKKYFVSEGSTVLQPGDKLYILADNEQSVKEISSRHS